MPDQGGRSHSALARTKVKYLTARRMFLARTTVFFTIPTLWPLCQELPLWTEAQEIVVAEGFCGDYLCGTHRCLVVSDFPLTPGRLAWG